MHDDIGVNYVDDHSTDPASGHARLFLLPVSIEICSTHSTSLGVSGVNESPDVERSTMGESLVMHHGKLSR